MASRVYSRQVVIEAREWVGAKRGLISSGVSLVASNGRCHRCGSRIGDQRTQESTQRGIATSSSILASSVVLYVLQLFGMPVAGGSAIKLQTVSINTAAHFLGSFE